MVYTSGPGALPSADLGHPVIMGRRVSEGLGRRLPGRHIIVLSRDPAFIALGCTVARDPDEALACSDALLVMVSVGEQVYGTYLSAVNVAHLTQVYQDV